LLPGVARRLEAESIALSAIEILMVARSTPTAAVEP
jgi:hypothetical protein